MFMFDWSALTQDCYSVKRTLLRLVSYQRLALKFNILCLLLLYRVCIYLGGYTAPFPPYDLWMVQTQCQSMLIGEPYCIL